MSDSKNIQDLAVNTIRFYPQMVYRKPIQGTPGCRWGLPLLPTPSGPDTCTIIPRTRNGSIETVLSYPVAMAPCCCIHCCI